MTGVSANLSVVGDPPKQPHLQVEKVDDALEALFQETRPLDSFLVEAASYSREEVENSRVADDGYRSPSWYFAGQLKAHPQLRDLSPWAAIQKVDEVIAKIAKDKSISEAKAWYELLGDRDNADKEIEPRADFIKVWYEVDLIRPGFNFPDFAGELDDLYPVTGDWLREDLDDSYRRTLGITHWLQRLLEQEGQDHFFLSCRDLARLADVSAMTASRLLDRARREEFVDYYGEKTTGVPGVAQRFTFDLDRVMEV